MLINDNLLIFLNNIFTLYPDREKSYVALNYTIQSKHSEIFKILKYEK